MIWPAEMEALIQSWPTTVHEPLSGHFSPVRTVVPTGYQLVRETIPIGHMSEVVALMLVPPPAVGAPLRL
jgi:hypothetical protein